MQSQLYRAKFAAICFDHFNKLSPSQILPPLSLTFVKHIHQPFIERLPVA
jgi:hypothetical protein